MLPDGSTGLRGAAALATPLGYTLGRGAFAGGYFNTSESLNPLVTDLNGSESRANGTAFAMAGGAWKGFNATLGASVLSRVGDIVFHVQVSPPPTGKLRFSVGLQDFSNDGGKSGEALDTGPGGGSSYLAGTYDLGHGVYISTGLGNHRFRHGFGSISAGINERLRLLVEHDGFNLNEGVVYGFGERGGVEASVFLGLVANRYGTIGVTIAR